MKSSAVAHRPSTGGGDGTAASLNGWDQSKPMLPGAERSPDTLAAWLQSAGPHGIVVVRHAQRHLYEIHLDEIVRISPRQRRVHLAQHGAFDFTGVSTVGPRRLTLLAPTAAALDAAVNGKTWLNGRPAFRRPHSASETELVNRLANDDSGSST